MPLNRDVIRQRLRRHVLDALDQRGLVRGLRIEFPRPGACELRSFEEGMPGPGEILVESLLTLVSPGTERAIYLGMRNVPATYPHVPGYCQVGKVAAVGPAAGVQPGEVVATSGAHASVHLCAAGRALVVPTGLAVKSAVAMQVGAIALQGVRKAAIQPGEVVAVLGCGLIGQLAAQLARLAGGDVVSVARSPERLAVATACGIERVLDARHEAGQLGAVHADVVIDATGQAAAFHDACSAAREGARLVLLGSNRSDTPGVDLQAWQRRRLVIIGAHFSTTPQTDASPCAWTWRRECEAFLGLAAAGRLHLGPLVTRTSTPGEAAAVYRDLAQVGDKSVAVIFDWSQPGPWRARVETVSPFRVLAAAGRRLIRRPGAPAPVFPRRRVDGRVLRFGLIGCGEIAAASAAALAAAANTTITFTVDPILGLARGLAAATGARASDSVEHLLASPEVDAVLISTPHHLHAPLAIRAAEAGKHVVVEKPMATSVAECDRMMDAADRYGVVLSVCYCQRFDPRVQRARALLEAGALGDVLSTRITFAQHRSADYWSRGLTGRTASDWRAHRATAGGGVLIMNACHILDYLGWLVGDVVVEVSACMATLTQAVEVEDTVSMAYRYFAGGLGTLEATTATVGPGVFEQTLRGRDGQMSLAPELRFWSNRTVLGYERGRLHTITSLPRPAERRHFFEAFADAVLDGGRPPVMPKEARAVQALIEAAYRAAAEHRAVGIGAP